MKSPIALLAFAVFVAFPTMAEETPQQIIPQLQAAYDQNVKAMDDGKIEEFMTLFAEDFVGNFPPDGKIDREQVREMAAGEMKQSRRTRSTYTIETVEFVDVEAGKRREIVATVLQTIVNEAIDPQGKRVKKSLKVHFLDTVARNGTNWQIKLREPQ